MKQFSMVLFSIAIVVFIASCGKEFQEAKESIELMKNLGEASESAEKTFDASERKLQERRAKGDTLPLPKEKLVEFLPSSIAGYTAGEPELTMMNMGEFGFSAAKITYRNNNNDYVEIELFDYNQTYSLLASVAFWAHLKIEKEDGQTKERTFGSADEMLAGFEKFDKVNNHAELTYMLGYRFLLNLRASNQTSIDKLKNIAESMNLKQLVNM